jgi:drug/metabolite transporter (DMT)-like permease
MVSIAAVLGSLYPVMTIMLARYVLHERLRTIQVLGSTLALGGVVLIAAAGRG